MMAQIEQWPGPAQLFLWHGQALYIGRSPPSTFHQHLALQVGVGLGQPISIRTKETAPYQPAQGFLVHPHTAHQIDAADAPALFIWTELLPAGPLMSMEEPCAGIAHLEPSLVELLLRPLRAADQQPLNCATARLLLEHVVDALLPKLNERPSIDERIAALMRAIEEGFFEEHSRPIALLARTLHLSPSRLRHLFHAQTGLALQRYILWHRLLRAVRYSASASSLTTAAHDAGFADLAHLSRVFRATFGLTPSEILKDSHSVQVTPCLP